MRQIRCDTHLWASAHRVQGFGEGHRRHGRLPTALCGRQGGHQEGAAVPTQVVLEEVGEDGFLVRDGWDGGGRVVVIVIAVAVVVVEVVAVVIIIVIFIAPTSTVVEVVVLLTVTTIATIPTNPTIPRCKQHLSLRLRRFLLSYPRLHPRLHPCLRLLLPMRQLVRHFLEFGEGEVDREGVGVSGRGAVSAGQVDEGEARLAENGHAIDHHGEGQLGWVRVGVRVG